jgi:hypothetical protein
MSAAEHFEVLILGSGQGGKLPAWNLARTGKSVVVVERQWVGGSCPAVACLPSKNEIWGPRIAYLAQCAALFDALTASGCVNGCFGRARQSRGVDGAKITYEFVPDLGHWSIEIIGMVKGWGKVSSGPFSPPGRYPQLINPPGSKIGPGSQFVSWGKATIPSVDAHGFKFEYSLNSAHSVRLVRALTGWPLSGPQMEGLAQ